MLNSWRRSPFTPKGLWEVVGNYRGDYYEKIIETHKRKRALADSILDGADTSAEFNIGELLEMIPEGNVVAGRPGIESSTKKTGSAPPGCAGRRPAWVKEMLTAPLVELF